MYVARYILIVLFILSTIFRSHSQRQFDRVIKFGYSAGVPFGGLNNYISGKSYDGLVVDLRYFAKDKIAIGFSSGWNSFKKELKRAVYPLNNGEISAVQTRYFRSLPVLLTGHYYFGSDEAKFTLYAGIGLGAYLLRYEKWYGVFPYAKDKWCLGARPEAGISMPLSEKVGLAFNIKYNWALYSYQDVRDFNFFEGGLGIFFFVY